MHFSLLLEISPVFQFFWRKKKIAFFAEVLVLFIAFDVIPAYRTTLFYGKHLNLAHKKALLLMS